MPASFLVESKSSPVGSSRAAVIPMEIPMEKNRRTHACHILPEPIRLPAAPPKYSRYKKYRKTTARTDGAK